MKMCRFQNENACEVTYAAVRAAMQDQPYTMKLVSEDIEEVTRVVNAGIDAHLEACYVPERGDQYEMRGTRLFCTSSVESLPVLLRRLFENDPVSSVASSILLALGFNEFGEQVGREALGLE